MKVSYLKGYSFKVGILSYNYIKLSYNITSGNYNDICSLKSQHQYKK